MGKTNFPNFRRKRYINAALKMLSLSEDISMNILIENYFLVELLIRALLNFEIMIILYA